MIAHHVQAMSAVVLLGSGTGCSLVTDYSDLTGGSSPETPPAVPDGWLRTVDGAIEWWDGEPLRGRGANLHDTRSCWSCAWEEPNPSEVERRMDLLIDEWQASLLRLNLESYPENGSEVENGAVQWRGVLEDPQYLDDLQSIVRHVAERERVAVLLSLWVDPSMSVTGLPTEATRAVWELITETFAGDGHVVFGLVDGPAGNADGLLDAEAWEAMNETVATIRAVETRHGVPPHLIAVQGTRDEGADLRYYVEHPIAAGDGQNIVYDAHIWNQPAETNARFLEPARTLPVILGAFGPSTDPSGFTLDDCRDLMDSAESRGIPHLAWTFHTSCSPSLVSAASSGETGCLANVPLEPTEWGEVVKSRLSTPW
ncbi:MAG: cellulase family glycosylhydrolase [Polyangiaceae bacterium]|nr:cellulase family glycosylhydrolase [Polyangiaceae bacterium]